MTRVGSTARRLAEKPYERRICRSENYPNCLDLADEYVGPSCEEYMDLMAELGLEVQVVALEHDRGTPVFPSKILPPHPYAERSRLPRFLELAHEKGIIVIGYYPMIYTKPLKAMHPEWLMKFLDDGRPAPENLGWFCFNSPYRDWLPRYLIEFMDNLDIDGFYFDDMNWGSHEDGPWFTGCCCDDCRALFKEETGLDIPTRIDFDPLDFRRWVNWRYDKLREYIAHVVRAVHAKHPDAIMDFNYYGEQTIWAWAHPMNPLRLEEVGAHFFMETGWALRENRCSFSAKVARAHGSPFALWRHPMQQVPECMWGIPPSAEPLSPILHGLTAIANGGAPIHGMWQHAFPLVKDFIAAVFGELRERVDYMEGETVKYVALHCSQQARDFLPAEPDGPARGWQGEELPEQEMLRRCRLLYPEYLKGVKGAFEMLTQSHLLADIVFDEQLALEKLARYKVLALFDSGCLSDAQCAVIQEFVAGGGTLLATHETSLYDDLGQRRGSFALADVLGLDYEGPAQDGSSHGVAYVLQEEALRDEFGHVICFAGRESRISVRRGADVRVLCTRISLEGSRPLDAFDLKAPHDSGEPTVTVNAFGKGRAIYVSGDVGHSYLANPYPPLRRFIARLVRLTPPPIEVDAPRAIEVTAAMRPSGELMIHLLNNPTPQTPFDTSLGDIKTYFYLEEVNPIRDIRITFHDFRPMSATMPLSGLSLEPRGTPAVVVVPEVKLHEVVIVELANEAG